MDAGLPLMNPSLKIVRLTSRSMNERIDAMVKSHQCGWFWHRPIWRDYEMARNPRLIDHSWAVTVDSVPVACQLLTYNPDLQLLGLGDLPAPVGLYPAVEVPGVTLLMAHVFESTIKHFEGRLGFRMMPLHPHFYPGINDDLDVRTNFYEGWSQEGWEDKTIETRIIDLNGDDLWSSIRKSYRHIISNSHDDILVSEEHTDSTRGICQDLHRRASGRQTRPSESWIHQEVFVSQDDASWFVARDRRTSEPVGFAYVLRWKGWAYYASAATVRPNVAHPLQWAIIQRLKEQGVLHYEMGYQGQDMTSKGQGIEFFRRGFGGYDIAQPTYSSTLLCANSDDRTVH